MSKRKLTYKSFKQYFSNNLPNKEKHDFEKDMMHDVFEEEAFDGLSKLNEEELVNDIIDLKAAINKRAKKRRVLIPIWYRYAASVVILVGIGLSILLLNNRFWQDSMLKEQFSEDMEIMDSILFKVDVESELISGLSQDDSSKDKTDELIAANTEIESKETQEIIFEDAEISELLIVENNDVREEAFDVDNQIEIVEFDEEEEIFEGEEIAFEEPVVSEQALYAEADIRTDENIAKEAEENKIEITSQKSSQPMAVRAKKSKNEANIESTSSKGIQTNNSEAKSSNSMEKSDFEKYIIEKIDYSRLSEFVGNYTIKFNFTVNTTGELINFEFTKSPDIIFNNEIIRIMTEAGNWIPATENNQNIDSIVKLSLDIEVK